MKKLSFAILIITFVIMGCYKPEDVDSAKNESVIITEDANTETPQEEYDILFGECLGSIGENTDKWLGLTGIEPQGDKYVLKGYLWKTYTITEEEFQAVKAGGMLEINGEEYTFTDKSNNMQIFLEETKEQAYMIVKDTNDILYVKETNDIYYVWRTSDGELWQKTDGYVEIEVDGDLPFVENWGGGPEPLKPIRTVEELAESLGIIEDHPYYPNTRLNIKVKNGEYIELYGRIGGV